MLIVCPSCASEYTIDPAKLGAGRTVRCAICRDTWYVQNPEAASGADASPQPEPDQDGGEPAPRSRDRPKASAASSRRKHAAKRPGKTEGTKGRRGWAALALASAALVGAVGVRIEPLQSRVEAVAGALGLASPGHGLVFRDVTSELVGSGAERRLIVDGEIVSRLDREMRVPRLAFSVRDGGDRVVATWSNPPPRERLGAGEAIRFSTRLTAPPTDSRQVQVQFTAGILDRAAKETP